MATPSAQPAVVETVASYPALDALEPTWASLAWGREEAAFAYYRARLRARPEVLAPFALLACAEDGAALGALAGRLEQRRLATSIGYRTVYAPAVRLIALADGGIVGSEPVLAALCSHLAAALRSGVADLVTVPPLALDSPAYRVFAALGGPLERQPLIAPWTRRRLALPESFEAFVASRSANTRWRIRREARRLEERYGERLSVEIIRGPEGLERLVGSASAVARLTYQHALGAGFADTPEQRELAAVGLRHGWVRGYLLFLDGQPVAYWYCSTYAGSLVIRTTGYDHALAEQRFGVYLLMRVIEDACADPQLQLLDFGPGDAPYKQQFSSEETRERNLVVFAPTWRGRRLNATRSLLLGGAQLARSGLDRARLTERLRSGWRSRLRRGG